MRRRDVITAGPAALLAGTSADGQSAQMPAPPRLHELSTVDVRRDFGAKADGVADDWQAIENAGLFLERQGGGRMYFPSGRYRLGGIGRNITVRNNVTYFGDGHSSVIMGSNAAFVSPNGAAFGRSAYSKYRYYAIRDITSGDRFLTFDNPGDLSNFKPGDIVIARSADAIITPGDLLPFYVEMNRVAAVTGNRLELEDAIDDGWSGVIAANVTTDIVQGYAIHDLRIECENGYPFFIQGSYKSFIRHCWTRGFAVACFNGFTRSMAHDIIATVVWQQDGTSASLFEIETGSVRANFHDIDVHLHGAARPGARYPLVYCQEFSRRTLLRGIRIAAAETDLGTLFEVMSGNHRFENIDITARSLEKVLDYWVREPSRYQLGRLGLSLENVTVEALAPGNGFNHGFILHSDGPDGEVQNVTIRNCAVKAAADQREHNLIWFYRGRYRNVLFDGVTGSGLVAMNAGAAQAAASSLRLADPLANVALRNCEFSGPASQELLDQVRFISCRRSGGDLPAAVRSATANWSSDKPLPQLVMSLPANATICRGDSIAIRLVAHYAAQPFAGHLRITAMGTEILLLALSPSLGQEIDIDLTVIFGGGTFAQPDRFAISGPVRINNATATPIKHPSGSFDRRVLQTVEMAAWVDKPATSPVGFEVRTARIAFREVEGEG